MKMKLNLMKHGLVGVVTAFYKRGRFSAHHNLPPDIHLLMPVITSYRYLKNVKSGHNASPPYYVKVEGVKLELYIDSRSSYLLFIYTLLDKFNDLPLLNIGDYTMCRLSRTCELGPYTSHILSVAHFIINIHSFCHF